MKKHVRKFQLFLAFIVLMPLMLSAQTTVTVDNSNWIEFPLMKIYGVNIPTNVSFDVLQTNAPLLKDLNVRYSRVLNNWGRESTGQLFPNKQVTVSGGNVSIDFTQIDKVVDLLQDNGTNVMLNMGYTPQDMNPDWKATPDTSHLGAWYALSKEYAQHWVDRGDLGIHYEVWNGADSSAFFNGTPKAWSRIVRESIYGIREANPDAKVGGGAFFSGKANKFKDESAAVGSYGIEGQDTRIANMMRFFTGQTTGLQNLKDMVERGDDAWGSFRRWTDWFDFMHWEIYFTGYSSFPLNSADAVNYKGSSQFLEDASYILRYSDVNRIYLNQFIDGADGSKGLVSATGAKSPLYNTLKLYNEMPFDRKAITGTNENIHGFASSDEHSAYIALWNMSATDQNVEINQNNLPFAQGTVNLYKIDVSNDGSSSQSLNALNGNSFKWTGTIGANGVVFIKIVNNTQPTDKGSLGTYIYDQNYWWFRASQPWNWHTFDPETFTFFIGDTAKYATPDTSAGVNWGVTSVGVYMDNIVPLFRVKTKAQGHMADHPTDVNNQLVFRINFQDTIDNEVYYAKSIVFYDDDNFIFNKDHESNFCFPTCAREDVQIKVDFKDPDGFVVDLEEYASPYWNGKVVLIAGLQNPGTGIYYNAHPGEQGVNGLMLKFSLVPEGGNAVKNHSISNLGMNIYPIPSNDIININMDEQLNGLVSIKIADITGKTVKSVQYNSPGKNMQIGISDLETGMYFLITNTTKGTAKARFLKVE